MKPGTKTTEYWTTLFIHLISVVTLVLSATGSAFDTSKLNSLVPVAAMIASGIAQSSYSHSRGKVKAAPTPNTETTGDSTPVGAVYNEADVANHMADYPANVPPFNG